MAVESGAPNPWLSPLVALLAFLVSAASLYYSCNDDRLTRALEVDNLLDDAFDALGGRTNTTAIFGASAQWLDPASIEQADRLVRRALKLGPRTARAHLMRGHLLAVKGRQREAVKAYCQAIRWRDDYSEAFNSIGSLLSETGSFELALPWFERAKKIDTQNALYRFNLGNVHHRAGRLEEARAELQEAVRFWNREPAYHFNLANVFYDLERYDEAARAYQQSIALDPTDPDAHFNLALALEESDRQEEARQEHDLAEELYAQRTEPVPLFPVAEIELNSSAIPCAYKLQ